MIIKGTIESKPTQTAFGCIISDDGSEYLFDSSRMSQIGDVVSFEPYLVCGKFLRAKNTQNYLQVLENYYWIFIGNRQDSDERILLDQKLSLLDNNKMNVSNSRIAEMALGFLSNK